MTQLQTAARVTSSDHPYTLLQQRLQYASQDMERDWTIIADNVPQWPTIPLPLSAPTWENVAYYAPCTGLSSLHEAICAHEHAKYGIPIGAEHLLITNGGLYALSLLSRFLYRPGAVALCQAPMFGSLADILQASGYRLSLFSLQNNPQTIDDLRERCTPDVGLIYINTPHNPTGVICADEHMQQLVQLANECKIPLIVDMVYDSFVFDNPPLHSPLVHGSSPYLYIVNSMSKNFGAPGLRVGWIIADTDNIRMLAGLLERDCVAVSGGAQQAACDLLVQGNQPLVEQVYTGKCMIERSLADIPGVAFAVPAGGTQFFVQLPVDDIEAFADHMLVHFGLVLTTASNYTGVTGSFIRIPTGYPLATLQRALDLLATGIQLTCAEQSL